jgi:hypothetical protein
VGITGDGTSPAPARPGAMASAAASSPTRAAAPDLSSPAGFGAYATAKDASATPGIVAGPIVQGANPTDERALNGSTSEQHTFGETSAPSDGGRGFLLAGSLVLLWAGIALLVVRQLVRRSVPR